jgi:hypothetical protein
LLVEHGEELLELSLINSRVSSRKFAIGMSHFPINHSGPSIYYHAIHVSMRKRNSSRFSHPIYLAFTPLSNPQKKKKKPTLDPP